MANIAVFHTAARGSIPRNGAYLRDFFHLKYFFYDFLFFLVPTPTNWPPNILQFLAINIHTCHTALYLFLV